MNRPGAMTVPERPEARNVSATERARAHRLLNHGADLLGKGQVAQAIPLLELAHQLLPGSVPALLNLGGAYVLASRYEQAVPLLEAARDLEPLNAMAWLNLGAAYLGNPILASSEQQLQAIDAFAKAADLDPPAPSAHYNLGLIFNDRGEVNRARAAFRQALQVDPHDRDARHWLATLQKEAG